METMSTKRRDRVQIVGQWISFVMVLATVTMAAATFWMAKATRDLAKTAHERLALEQSPSLSLRKIVVKQVPVLGAVQVQIHFRNPSRLTVTYRFTDLRVTYDGRTAENATYDVMGGDVAPDDEGFFQCFPISGITDARTQKPGTISYNLTYWNETSVTNTDHASLYYYPSGNGYEWIKSPSYQAIKVPVTTP